MSILLATVKKTKKKYLTSSIQFHDDDDKSEVRCFGEVWEYNKAESGFYITKHDGFINFLLPEIERENIEGVDEELAEFLLCQRVERTIANGYKVVDKIGAGSGTAVVRKVDCFDTHWILDCIEKAIGFDDPLHVEEHIALMISSLKGVVPISDDVEKLLRFSISAETSDMPEQSEKLFDLALIFENKMQSGDAPWTTRGRKS